MGKTKKPIPNSTCCVVGCFNNEYMSDEERFYLFPLADEKQRSAWIAAVRKINGAHFQPDCCTLICCHHFVGKRKSLKPLRPNYVPTVFPSIDGTAELESVRTNCNPSDIVDSSNSQANQSTMQIPETSSIITSSDAQYYKKPENRESVQFEFIDHVVMTFLNRCRSRAGNAKVGMPHYILKGKAQEAAVLLGARHEDGFHWIEKFKRKIIEHDAKGVVLSSKHESINIADIIDEEWPKFAEEKGLDIDEDVEDTISTDEPQHSIQTENGAEAQTKNLSSDDSGLITPSNKTTSRKNQPNKTSQNQNMVNKQPLDTSVSDEKFLKHVLMVFVRRFNASWPHAHMPDIILNSKFREAAIVLGSNIKNKNVWICAFKISLQKKNSDDIFTEPNQSLDINDIIEEERLTFPFENKEKPPEESELEEPSPSETNTADEDEPNSVEFFDSIQTYEEARDCLNLLNNYASELEDLSALSLIKQVDSFLRSDNCEE